jgi:hypothetical protein
MASSARGLAVALFVATIGAPTALYAQDAAPAEAPAEPAPPSAAEAFYEQGLKDMLAGNFEAGCPSLSESYKLDPMPGALFTLAECFAKWGKLATAQSQYSDYLDRVMRMTGAERNKQQGRIEVAEEQIKSLATRVPQLTIVTEADLPPGAVVTRNGERVLPAMLNRELPVDPGAQQLKVEAPGYVSAEYSRQLSEGQRQELRIAPLVPTGANGAPPPSGEGGGTGITRTWAYVAGGVGVAGLLVGAITGGITIGHKGTIDDNCIDVRCNADGIDAADAATTTGAISTVGFIVGGIGLAAGVTFWFLADDDSAADQAGAAPAGLRLGLRSSPSPDGSGAWFGLNGQW